MAKLEGLDDIKKQLEKIGQEASKKIATEARDMLAAEYERIVGIFYGEYNPQYYKRHTRGGMYRTFSKYYKNPHNRVYYGGIVISPEKMYGDYSGSQEDVLGSYLSGYHGPVNMGIYSSINPLEHMLKYRDYLVTYYFSK